MDERIPLQSTVTCEPGDVAEGTRLAREILDDAARRRGLLFIGEPAARTEDAGFGTVAVVLRVQCCKRGPFGEDHED